MPGGVFGFGPHVDDDQRPIVEASGEFVTADQRGNARKRLVNRTLPVIADRYGLVNCFEIGDGNSREYRIARSERLSRFAEKHLVTGVRNLMGEVS